MVTTKARNFLTPSNIYLHENLQTEGHSIYADLRRATGVLEPEDTSDFHDISLRAIVSKMGRIEYAAI
jgi:hypothetical protein